MNKPLMPLLLVFGLAAAGWYLATRTTPAPTPTTPPPAQPAPGPGQPTAIERADPPPPPSTLAAEKLRMPDGSFVEPLNGVKKPAEISWGTVPWSPIVRQEHNNGLDWYVHADGTYTTTMMQWRGDLRREDPVTLCLHPATPAPTEPPPGGGPEAPEKQKR